MFPFFSFFFPDFIFRAPIKLSKTGELREEYESQLRKLREEKLQEEKTSEDLINKFILDDMDVGKRKMEEQQKKDESVVLKGSQECVSKLMLLLPVHISEFSFFGFPGFLD